MNATQIPKISAIYDGTNYALWRRQLELTLRVSGWWDAADPEGKDDIAAESNMLAMHAIVMSMNEHYQSDTLTLETAREILDYIDKKHKDDSVERQYRLDLQLSSLTMKSESSIEDHWKRSLTLRRELQNAGRELSDKMFIMYLLKSLPSEYHETVAVLKHQEVTVEMLKEKLLRVEIELKEDGGSNPSDVFAIQHRRPRNRSRRYKFNGKCYNCGKKGHRARDCRSKKRSSSSRRWKDPRRDHRGEEDQIFAIDHARTRESNWILDSGATVHICADVNLLTNLRTVPKINLTQPDGSPISSTQVGTATITTMIGDRRSTVRLRDTILCPELRKNIISLSKIDERGGQAVIGGGKCRIYAQKKLVLVGRGSGGLYHVTNEVSQRKKPEYVCNIDIWHQRLGHIAPSTIRRMQEKGIVDGVPDFDKELNNAVCKSCMDGKMKRSPHPRSKTVTELPLDLVHSDVVGPLAPSPGGYKYLVTFIDDCTRYKWIALMKKKSEVPKHLEDFLNLVENQTERRVKRIRTDNGGEYVSKKMDRLCKERGIRHQRTMPYTPQQNGVAERANRSILEMAESMLSKANMPVKYWTEDR